MIFSKNFRGGVYPRTPQVELSPPSGLANANGRPTSKVDATGLPCMILKGQIKFIGVYYTVFILIVARRASAGISTSEMVLISGENNYCDRNTTYPLYITSFQCYMTY